MKSRFPRLPSLPALGCLLLCIVAASPSPAAPADRESERASPLAELISATRAAGVPFKPVNPFRVQMRANAPEAALTREALRDGLVLAPDQAVLGRLLADDVSHLSRCPPWTAAPSCSS